MLPSQDCSDLIKEFEGCQLKAYKDGGGVLTIGYGHIVGVKQDDVCTQEQALLWLHQDLTAKAALVYKALDIEIPQSCFDACVSFAFNLGIGNFQTSTLLKDINSNLLLPAAQQFVFWINDNGKPVKGLLRRRLAEANLFIKDL